MKNYFLSRCAPIIAAWLLSAMILTAQEAPYSRARIWFDGKLPEKLGELGIDLLEGTSDPAGTFTSDFSSTELEMIRSAGLRTEILIPDVQAYYAEQNLTEPLPENNTLQLRESTCDADARLFQLSSRFRYGSMGGYLTLAEMLQVLDSMHLAFPQLITVRQAIDTTRTHQNREIVFVKISDNPAVDEDEPEVLYTALHHAREPMSLMQLIGFMWYLLENYEQDEEIRNIVNHTELYFVPCVNPDGYEYNRSTNPNGGGMWRKNRRKNSGNSFGVDLNRNYPFEWGNDNSGSSPNIFSETYRGPSPASEPEIRAMIAFCKKHNFVLADNYHTYTNVHILPWGFTDKNCPDSNTYQRYARKLTAENNFTIGRSVATVGYPVNGNSDDWMYGETSAKPKILAMTPEVGDAADGFWPARSKIIPFCRKQLHSNFMLAKLAGRFGQFIHHDSAFVSNGTVSLPIRYERIGQDTGGTYTARLVPLSANINSAADSALFTAPSLFEAFTDTLHYTLAPDISPEDEIRYVIELHNGLFLIQSDTIVRFAGSNQLIDLSSEGNWSLPEQGGWGVSSQLFYSGNSSFTDSPNGNYGAGRNLSISLEKPVDLRPAIDAVFRFYARWYLEFGTDYAQVEVSKDEGQTWEALCGKYTQTGTGSFQPAGSPLFGGLQDEWVLEEMSLNDFLGSEVLIRFRLKTNESVNRDGFYFDDAHVQLLLPDFTGSDVLADQIRKLDFYPNPARVGEPLYLSSGLVGESYFTMLDITGSRVFSGNLKLSPNNGIQLPPLTSGMYLISVNALNGEAYHGKIIVTE